MSKPKKKKRYRPPAKVQRTLAELNNPKNHVVQRTQSVTRHFQGPLPSPETLKAYNDLLPGSNIGGRLIAVFEKQTEHRLQIEKMVIQDTISGRKWGQFLAFLIASGALSTAAYCAYVGAYTPASIIGGSTVVSLASTFISGKYFQKKERQEK